MQKEKVMTVSLMRSDLYDTPGYAGAYLLLPASTDEMQDAMDRARIRDGMPFQITEAYNIQGEELSFLPDKPSLAELNFLAYRISELTIHDRIAFHGCTAMNDGRLDMKTLINLTYSLDDVHVVPVSNDRSLGKFYVDNDFVDAVNHMPQEYQAELLELLDYEKIGHDRRIEEGGVFRDGYYVVKGSGSIHQEYDSIHLPDLPEEALHIFRLQLTVADFEMEDREPDKTVLLLLPADNQKILTALEQLEAASLEECVFTHCNSPIPMLEQAFSFSEDIEKMNLLAERIRELEDTGEFTKFKAILETSDCSDIDQMLNITGNLDCYDFYPDISSAEEYTKQEFLNRYHIPEHDPAVGRLCFNRCDPGWLQEVKVAVTSYGILHRNEREMRMEHSIRQSGQQMV